MRNSKFSRLKRHSGSALLLVILVISGITTLVFGAQRLVLIQYNQATAEEDSLLAYYAAKAGIEDGLMRFRAERDVETALSPTLMVFRYNLTTGQSVQDQSDKFIEIEEGTPLAGPRVGGGDYHFSYKPTDQIYDLKIQYRQPKFGFRDGAADYTNLNLDAGYTLNVLSKDQYLELTGFQEQNTNAYYLRYKFKFESCPARDGRVQIQKITADRNGGGQLVEQIVVDQKLFGTDEVDSTNPGLGNISVPTNGRTISSLRLRPYNCPIRFGWASSRTPNGLGDAGNDGPPVDSLKTFITATGYFGNAKRTVVAEISRKSGQLLQIYDFNLYAGQQIAPR